MKKCPECKKEFDEADIYSVEGKEMCENCAIKVGLFPLEHTGARRDKISEKGRFLTRPRK